MGRLRSVSHFSFPNFDRGTHFVEQSFVLRDHGFFSVLLQFLLAHEGGGENPRFFCGGQGSGGGLNVSLEPSAVVRFGQKSDQISLLKHELVLFRVAVKVESNGPRRVGCWEINPFRHDSRVILLCSYGCEAVYLGAVGW